jgi:uncharacterized repeat protein (TIGR01451 family)
MDFNHDGGSIMHELGHNLNLDHGGNEGDNCKPNYVSVMNYDNQFGINRNGGGGILDYSPPRVALDGTTRGSAPLGTLVESSLNEATILDSSDTANRFVFVNAGGNKVQNPLNQGANWNGDADPPTESGLTVNVDTVGTNGRPSACSNTSTGSTLQGAHDWNAVSLPFRQFGDAANAPISPELDVVPTLQDLVILQQELNTTDLSVAVSDSPDPVAAGTELTYTLTVANGGPNPASSVQVVHTLPPDVSFVGGDTGCAAAGGAVTCTVPEMGPGTTRALTITVAVPADLVYNNGGPKTLSATATVANLVAPDSNPANNTDVETTLVIAVADLAVTSLTTTSPLEVLIGQPVAAAVEAVVSNGGPSSPVDAVLTGTATADAGAGVVPAATSSPVAALAVGAPRTINQPFTVSCAAPGVKTISFSYTISLANAADVDPDLVNNTRTTSFTIDCVVPVAINIRPGGFPNSINLNTDATLAVLTTAAGEYGLPLAFDAKAIDISTVLYGLPTNLFNVAVPSGATETHAKNHLEDSFELDEKTRDGDLDGVMHFKPDAAGLTSTTTEACVKGRYSDGGGTFTFFGCDSVVVRGG